MKQNHFDFLTFIKKSLTPIMVVNGQGIITSVNDEALRIFLYRDEELYKHSIEKVIPQDFLPRMPKLLAFLFQINRPLRLGKSQKLKLIRSDQRLIDVEVNLSPFTVKGEKYLLVQFLDISLRRTEKELKIFQLLVEKTNDMIIIANPFTGQIIHLNERAQFELEIIAPSTSALNLRQICPDLIDEIRNASVKGDMNHLQQLIFESYLIKKSDQRIPVEINTNVFYDHENIYLCTVARDLTDRKKIEKAKLEQMMIRTEKMASLGEMAGALAHEMNSPLGSMILNLEELREAVLKESPNVSLIQEITNDLENSAQTLNTIVKGVKTYIRDGSRDSYRSVDIKDLIIQSIEICNKELMGHSIKASYFYEVAAHEVLGNPSQLMQVFMNLINNAKDAIKAHAQEGTITVRSYREQDQLIIKFLDSGPGVPQDIRHKIFEPFFTTKDIGKGTGLGLGICKNILESHNGNLYLEEQGATAFCLKLPLASK